MAKIHIAETRTEGNEKKNIKLTFDMLQGMAEALADMDATTTYAHAKPARKTQTFPIKTVKKGTLNAEYLRTWGTDAQQALPLEYLEEPEAQTLDIDYMRKKYTEATNDMARALWATVGKFAVQLNEIKTKQELLNLDVVLPTDDFLADYCRKLINRRMQQLPSEHALICHPDFSNLEGMEAISKHLGETMQPKPHKVKGEKGRFLSGAEGLNTLEKIIYNEAQFTGQGEAVLPHEDRSKRAWFMFAGGVKKQFSCTTEEAEKLFNSFQTIGINAKLAKEFKTWIEGTSVKEAVDYFSRLASDLEAVSAENDGKIIDIYTLDEETNKAIDADNPAETDVTVLTGDCITLTTEFTTIFDRKKNIAYTIKGKHGKKEFAVTTVEGKPATKLEEIETIVYHKLDDSRDFAPTWESRQPAIFRNGLKTIRETKDLAELKALGVKLFKLKEGTLTKTQTTVIWDEYKRAKHRLEPKLRPLALKALERMTDKKVNLSKVAAWLHGEGKTRLTAHEQSVIWATWKKAKKAYAPKQTLMNNWSWQEADKFADKEADWRLEQNIRMSSMTEAEINGTFEPYEDMLFTIPD